MMPGQFGPMRRVLPLSPSSTRRTLSMSMHRDALGDADDELAARRRTPRGSRRPRPAGGTKMHAGVRRPSPSPPASTVSKTGTLPSNFSPPRPGVTPATTLRAVLDASAWRGTSRRSPVMPWTSEPACPCRRGCSLAHLPAATAATIFCAPSAIVRRRLDGEAALARGSSCPSSTFVPSSRTTSGTLRPSSFAAATTPLAMTSHFMMPPKMLTKMRLHLGALAGSS